VDITAHIRELLFGHDCVIVPGFGGFIGNHTPAHIDKSTGTFFPPVKQISFNRNLNNNDGLLIGKISGSSGINYGDARTLVEDYVSVIRRRLEKGEKVVFDNIGSFSNNQEGNIQFEPDRDANYHLGSYGLEPFKCLPLEGYDVRKQIVRHIGKDPVKRAAMRKILWRAAVIIPLLSVMVVVPLKTDILKSKVETTTLNPLLTAEFENNKKAVDAGIDASENKTEVNQAEINEPVVAPVAPVVVPVVEIKNTYYLITGSFVSRENAESQAGMLKAEGFEPEIVTAPNGFFRVSAMLCDDLTAAKSRKDSISKKFPGSWISRKK
jgi:nucleoid DNA-binding protein